MIDKNELLETFNRIAAGMTEAQVEELLGKPDSIKDLRVPAGSGWGEQDGFWVKIRPGDRYREWMYQSSSHDLTVWFASVEDTWITAMRLPIPRLH